MPLLLRSVPSDGRHDTKRSAHSVLVMPSRHDYASEVNQERLSLALQWRDDDSPERLRSTFLRQLLVVSGKVGHAQSFQVQGLIISVYRK